MSQLEVDKIIPSSGTTINIGDAGDTVNISDGTALTVDTNTLAIDQANNRVGIGTTSPSQKLEVVGGNGDQFTLDNTGQSLTQAYWNNNGTNKGAIWAKTDEFTMYGYSGVHMRFYTNASERMRIDSSGNVGVGTTNPTQALTVNGQMLSTATSGASFKNITPTTDNNYLWLGNTGNNMYVGKERSTGGSLFVGSSAYAGVIGNDGAYPLQFATNNNVRATIDSSGRLLVGTTSTTINTSNFGFVFDASTDVLKTSRNVNGGGTSAEHFGNAGQIRFMGDGDAENTNNSYGALSDRTLKENETNANSQWNDIKALQIKNYNLIEYPDRPQIGVIAQDLEEAGMNGLVKTDDEGLKSVKYSVLYMKAVKCLQEAQTKIETLESTVADLTTRLEALENA